MRPAFVTPMSAVLTAEPPAGPEWAFERNLDGIRCKRLGTPYVSARSRDWLKLKCTRAQELVIGGFTAPRGSRTDLGALLVGHFEGDRFRSTPSLLLGPRFDKPARKVTREEP